MVKRRSKKVKKPKFKLGDRVYSWENPTSKARIIAFRRADPYDGIHRYKMRIQLKNGSSRNSKWHNEGQLSKRKKR